MKNLLKLTVATAMLSATPAMACTLEGSREPSTLTLLELSAPATPGDIVNKLANRPDYKNVVAACSPKQVLAKLLALNGWSVTTQVASDYRFSVPLLVAPASQPATVATPVVQPVPAALPAPAPQPVATVVQGKDYGPELAELRRQRAATATQVAALERALRQRPVDIRTHKPVVSGAEAKLLEELKAKDTSLQNQIDSIMSILTTHSAAIANNAKGIAANTGRLNGIDNTISGMKNDVADANANAAEAKRLAESAGGIAWWQWVLIGLVALIIGGVAFVALWNARSSKKQVQVLARDVTDGRSKRHNIVIEENMEEVLEALVNGELRDVHVEFDGMKGLLGFIKSGKGQVTTTQIDRQTQAMNIKSLRSTLLRHIGAGRVTLNPYPQSLATAAA